MDLHEIEADFRTKVAERLRVASEGVNRYRIFTPFMFDDGDHLSIVLRRERDRWVLSDEGNTFMRLSYRLDEKSLHSGTRQKVISDALSNYGVDDDNGELRLIVPGDAFGDALYTFVQGLLRISDVTLLSRERVQSAFMDDFRAFIEEAVPPEHRTFDWHHPQYDPEGMYPVDCYLNGAIQPTAIFALPGDAKVRDATITLLKFEQWAVPVRSVGVFEDQESVNRAVLARFSDVCDKQYSSLTPNRARLRSFFAAIGAARPTA